MPFKPIVERPEAAKIREKNKEEKNEKESEKDFYGDDEDF